MEDKHTTILLFFQFGFLKFAFFPVCFPFFRAMSDSDLFMVSAELLHRDAVVVAALGELGCCADVAHLVCGFLPMPMTTAHIASTVRRILTVADDDFRAAVETTFGCMDDWDVSYVTNMNAVFRVPSATRVHCHAIDLSRWNTSRVTTMQGMFQCARGLSFSFRNWDTSNVTDMAYMFSGCQTFAATGLRYWNVSKCRTFNNMFSDCDGFDENLQDWNTSNAHTFTAMFQNCASLRTMDLSWWDVSNGVCFNSMFHNCRQFTGNFDDWDMRYALNCERMFCHCVAFRGSLAKWRFYAEPKMDEMFTGCISFRGDGLDTWYTSDDCDAVDSPFVCPQSASNMFEGCLEFDADLGRWEVKNLLNAAWMFCNCRSFRGTGLEHWRPERLRHAERMFSGCAVLHADLSAWRVPELTYASFMFAGCRQFASDVSRWNPVDLMATDHMFAHCNQFNSPLNEWNMRWVSNAHGMFEQCKTFNQPLDKWVVSCLRNACKMFYGCNAFNQPIGCWRLSPDCVTMEGMFAACTSFNQSLAEWRLASDVSCMFFQCDAFDQPVDSWDVSDVCNATCMFLGCKLFRGEGLASWQPRSLCSATMMFFNCERLQANLASWRPRRLRTLTLMFAGCIEFNADIAKWGPLPHLESHPLDAFTLMKCAKYSHAPPPFLPDRAKLDKASRDDVRLFVDDSVRLSLYQSH